MARKRRLRLKKKFKKLLVLVLVVIVVLVIGVHKIKEYKYHQTYEYKLLEVGYNKDIVSNLVEKLSNDKLDGLLDSEQKDYINDIINEKYYLDKNYDKYIKYYEENRDVSFSDVIAVVNVGADKDWYQDIKTTDVSNKYEMLVNKFYALPSDYDVGITKKFSATYAYGSVSAEETVYSEFIAMANAAKADGVTLVLSSGYREHGYQEKVYNDMVYSKGKSYADDYAARPGSSEHETGLALDILSTGEGAYTNNFDKTEAYRWLQVHSQEYGFILRYPDGKEHITGYKPESWHYRYLGVDLATKVKNEGITYDEYYAFYMDK